MAARHSGPQAWRGVAASLVAAAEEEDKEEEGAVVWWWAVLMVPRRLWDVLSNVF